MDLFAYIISNYSKKDSIDLREIFDTTTLRDMLFLGVRLSNALFRKINGEIHWDLGYDNSIRKAFLRIPINSWKRKIDDFIKYTKHGRSFRMKFSDFIRKISLNKYKIRFISEYLKEKFVIINEDLIYLSRSDLSTLEKPLENVNKIPRLLNIYYEYLPTLLKFGHIVTMTALDWLRKNYRIGWKILKNSKYLPIDITIIKKILKRS